MHNQPAPLQSTPSTIGDLHARGITAVHLTYTATDAVIIGADGDRLRISRHGNTEWIGRHHPADPIADHAHAVSLLSAELRSQLATIAYLQQRGHEHEVTLSAIRSYVIEWRHADLLSREALDRFLAQFEMERYQPTVRIHFTVHGHLDVDGEFEDAAELVDRVVDFLSVDAELVEGAVEDSLSFHVDTTDVQPQA